MVMTAADYYRYTIQPSFLCEIAATDHNVHIQS
jgi:hypothetical protein